MATWMLYATFVAVLIGAAAWALELALHPMRLPLRWIWAAALAGSCAFAVLPLFGKAPPLEAAATVVPSAPAAPIVADTPTLLDSGLPAHPGVFDRLRGVR